MPHVRPPYPVEQGLHGRPTLVNNVETFAFTPLQRAEIDPALCTTCDICRQVCPAKAIEVLDVNAPK